MSAPSPFPSAGGGQRRTGGIRWWVLLLFAGYAAWYWFSNRTTDPYTGEKVVIDNSLSPENEKALGLQAYQDILSQQPALPKDAPLSRQVQAIATRLIARTDDVEDLLAKEHGVAPQHIGRSFDWEVNVIPSDQANAFCLPGGKMAVYTGLVPVAQTADAMAVVMGHEIAHALLRHGAQRMTQQRLAQMGQMAAGMSGMDPQQQQMAMAAIGYGVLLPYGRAHETQADEVGLMLAAAACYDPQAAIPLWERMSQLGGGQRPPEFASTHPDPANRIQHLQALMPQAEAIRRQFCAGAAPATAPVTTTVPATASP
jgi:predicted Zn-dependent protease